MFRVIFKPQRMILVFAIVLLFLFVMTLMVMAGEGDGSGGGQGQPLSLLSSYPSEGQKDVKQPLIIKMTFSKNVINMTVKDNNRSCFELYSSDGEKIPIEVAMADDQMEPEKKRDILLKPLQELLPATTYTVKVAPGLKAKNGVTLGKSISLSFSTSGEVKPKEENSSGSISNKTVVSDTAVSTIPTPALENDKTPAADAGTNGQGEKTEPKIDGEKATSTENNPRVTPEAAAAAVSPSSSLEAKTSRELGTWPWLVVGLSLFTVLGFVIFRVRRWAGSKK